MRTNMLSRVLAVVMLIVMLVCSFPYKQTVNADRSVVLTLATTNANATVGDVVTITCSSDNMPRITRIEDIRFLYDVTSVEFVSLQPSPVMTGFQYTSSDDEVEGVVSITMIDEASETALAEDRESGAFNNSNYIDPSYQSDEETIIFSISFRVIADNIESAGFSIESVGVAVDSNNEYVNVNIGGSVSISTETAISSDSTLAGLAIEGVSIAPDFNSEVFDYTASVGRDVTDVVVTSLVNNLSATVNISGASNLNLGENIITIDVTAEDGITTSQYKIYLTRQGDVIPENFGVVDYFGRSYTIMDFASDITVPDGYILTNRIINGYNLPVYAREGVASVILYMYDGTNTPGLYFYNPTTRVILPYNPNTIVIRPSRIYVMTEVPSTVKVPEELTPGTCIIDDREAVGFYDLSNNFVVYLRDEMGDGNFYLYNAETQNYTLYQPVIRTKERAFRFLFYTFLFVATVEAVIIVVIILIIHQIVNRRLRPRPRRV